MVELLRRDGHLVRPAARSTPTKFDWDDRATWVPALTDATSMYLLAPADPDAAERLVVTAVELGVRRIVCLSARALEQFPTGTFDSMKAAEDAVRHSGVEWSVVRANNFNQNFTEDLWRAPLTRGELALSLGEVPEPFIDADDIAAVAATLLTSSDHHQETLDLTGPRGLSFTEAVSVISDAAGVPMRFRQLTSEEYRDDLLSAGFGEEVAIEPDTLFEAMRRGHYSAPRDEVARVLGRPPLTFEQFAARAAAERAWA